jgi:hypothetical protein
MGSQIAKDAEKALVEATQRLTPEQRLNAFLTHCRLLTQLHEAGCRIRSSPLEVPLENKPAG